MRDRIDREYTEPLDVEALARGVHMSAGHLSRQFRLTCGESPYSYLMTRRVERAMGAAPPWRPQRRRSSTPGVTDDERRTISAMRAKGTTAGSFWPRGTSTAPSSECRPAPPRSFRSRWSNPMGVRDCAFRDPAGNMVRIQELR